MERRPALDYRFIIVPTSALLVGISLVSIWYLRPVDMDYRQLRREFSRIGTKVTVKVDRYNYGGTVFLADHYGTITDAELAVIGRCKHLGCLLINKANVTDEGLVHLAGLTRLNALWLSKTKVTDQGMEHIQHLKGLREIDLSGTALTDAGLLQLSSLPRLERVDVRETRVTASGVAKLRESLPHVRVLAFTD